MLLVSYVLPFRTRSHGHYNYQRIGLRMLDKTSMFRRLPTRIIFCLLVGQRYWINSKLCSTTASTRRFHFETSNGIFSNWPMISAEELLPRINLPSTMNKLISVRGSFTMDASSLQEYFRVGVPVWFIRPDSWVSSPTKIIRVSSNVRPAGFYPAISWRLT